MADVPFAKAHALGNDFLLVEESRLGDHDLETFARCACDRHTGLGADGLVLLGPPAGPPWRAQFRIFNADGSEAGISGNALRCAAAWLLARSDLVGGGGDSHVEERDSAAGRAGQVVQFETRIGPRRLVFLGRKAHAWIFRAEMGRPGFAQAEIPFSPPHALHEPIIGYRLLVGDEVIEATVLSMGNPQCVVFVEDFQSLDWMGLGADIESHVYFPERANINFVRVLSPQRIEARFWERGAGHTLSSGTGACACAVATHLAGKTKRQVTVGVERGEVTVDWREDGIIELTGPAEITAEGRLY